MNILFICNQNKNRSKTAEELFKGKYSTKSAGMYNKKPLTKSQLAWSDVVIVMEDGQGDEIAKRFPKTYLQKRVLNLNIADLYRYNDPYLREQIITKMKEYTKLLIPP
ncbi:TPA: hypothetical protein HA278_00475 [Candidatus Woesearchaeota archaeon]|nr:hypothetical protein [archaeon]HIJ10504.1 hypothetical protein [Candidatus Woesearchaeota archaeon]|tara:strand:+ start:177 stop:500 length:324 start_codon:yes stop_codon:yes gene_type:complete